MKKFLSIILSAFFMLVSVLSVSAVQASAEINVSLNLFKVDVTVTTDVAAGKVTARITDKQDGSGSVLVGMYETSDYMLTEDGKYQYLFHFKMQPTHATGTYWVHVGNGVKVDSKDFAFVNIYDKIDFFNSLDGAAAVKTEDGKEVYEIYRLLTGENSKTSYDLTAYKALTDDVRLLVDKEIENFTLAATEETVEQVEAYFVTEMNNLMPLATLADANKDNWEDAVKRAVAEKLLDGTYYEKVSCNTIMKYFQSEGELTLEEKSLSDSFDKASVLAVCEELDYISLKNAFDYYVTKGIVNVNSSDYKEIYDKKLENDLFKELKEQQKQITTFTKLEDSADKIMKNLLNDYEDDDSSYSSGGSGGSGGGSSRPSGSSSKNSTPNSGVVIDGDAGATVNTVKNPTYNTAFSDLDSVKWAETGVQYLAGKGVLSGRGDGKFYPNDVMTREEFAKLVVTAFDGYDAEAECSFADVDTDSWSYRYIASAARLGLITGNERNEFCPQDGITREDMAVIMYRVYSISGMKGEAKAIDFTDADSISDYAREAVAVLTGEGIINGMGDGTFAPKSLVTRAQASKVVYELLMRIGGGN